MIGALIGFELRRRLKMLSTWVYAVVLFSSGAFLMAANAGLFEDISAGAGNERVFPNGPHAVYGNQTIMALMGLFMVAAIFGQAASQDFTTGTWALIFTRNVKKAPYLIGRFLGAYLLSAALFLATGAGQFVVAAIAQFIKPETLGPTRLDVFLWPWLVGVLPLLFIAGVVFFALAALTRQMAPVYVGVVVLVLGYFVLSAAMGDVQNRTLGALADPFGIITFDVVTRYWTPAERNHDLIPLTGLFLANKVIWLAVGGALFALVVSRFRTTVEEQKGARKKDDEGAAQPATTVPKAALESSFASWALTALRGGWLQFRDVLRSPVYWSFIAAGVMFVLIGIFVSEQLYGTATWAVSWRVLELASGSFGLFSLITLTFYAGELVWKERDAQLSEIIDSTRMPTWVAFVSKLVALVCLEASLQVVVAGSALAAQVVQGNPTIEWNVYFHELITFGLLQDVTTAVLALVVHLVINHKYFGHGAMIGYWISQTILSFVGVEDRLVRFGSEPRISYSDLNGYGHWVGTALTWRSFWWSVSVVLLTLAFGLMARGREDGLKARMRQVRARLTMPWRAALALGLIGTVTLGGYLFHQTHIAHRYLTAKDRERQQADYEKGWRSWLDAPTPRVTDVEVTFDVFPSETVPRLRARGTYQLENKTSATISEVLVGFDDAAQRDSLVVAGSTKMVKGQPEDGLMVFAIDPPMQPGDKRTMEFDFTFRSTPLKHGGLSHAVVGNGTFFNNLGLPTLGYVAEYELSEDGVRKKYGLAPKERMLDRDDPKGLQRNYIRVDSDFIGFRATVSTDPDQIAIAPGQLTKEWNEGGRRFFRYEMDQPILGFFSVLSARYQVKEDEWNGVKLQIFYDVHHAWNLDRMMNGMKDSLRYCSEQFGPYQHHQARIIEFPRYDTFAQSFPNTIPYSEAIGFIARVRPDKPNDIDYPYYVTAHEIAHQWWAHQVVGGDVQGATLTSETMAQYSALMVMKHQYGPEKMRRFLKYELDRYLIGRAVEQKKEVPLSRVENQPYIHYQKGSLVTYWLADLVGEETINRALKKYVAAVKFKGPPYTNSTQLLSFLREEVDPRFHPLLDDLFDRIVLYDNRATSASMKQNAAGGWDVTIKVKAVKYVASEKGEQSEVDFDDTMVVGALDEDDVAVCLEKRQIKKGESELTFTCPKKPSRAGVDPMNELIDRNSDDNTTSISTD
ncbi:MAG: M1 family aminopeptidase [Myxococcaceae bacterium]